MNAPCQGRVGNAFATGKSRISFWKVLVGCLLCFSAVPVVVSAEKPITGILLVSGNDLPLAVLPPNLYDLVDVALAYSTNHALAKDGTLYAWTKVDDLRCLCGERA